MSVTMTGKTGGSGGFVSLVGAGPGDPELLTRRAAARLGEADLVLYDALVEPAALDLAPRAQRIFVGKRAGRPQVTPGVHHAAARARRAPRPAGRAAEGRRPVRVRARRRGSARARRSRRALAK